MKRYRLNKGAKGGRGIAWHIRGIFAGRFYGELRFDMPETKTFNCKYVKGVFQQDHWKLIMSLIEKLEIEEFTCAPNVSYWSVLTVRDGERPVELIAGYFPGDENKTEAGKTYKQLLSVIEENVKEYYACITPEGEDEVDLIR